VDEDGLEVPLSDILTALKIAGDHYNAKSKVSERLENRWQVALGIIDRALMESDRGVRFMELTNRVSDLESEIAILRGGISSAGKP
jgi:hypothetical protein